jgi:EAL domain-containing protein (putative c-di-GMP-specific phosphodiesterase class I)
MAVLSPSPFGAANLGTESAHDGDPSFTFAFQPIIDVQTREVFSYEALIRGPGNETAHSILKQVPGHRIHGFDQKARIEAIFLAARLGIGGHLNLNALPQSVCCSASTILPTLEAASRAHLPVERLIIEITEGEVIEDQRRFADAVNEFRSLGLKVAIDDFGAGYAGLNLLADFQPDQVKIDLKLVRGIHRNGPRQAIVRAISQACSDLGIDVIAEGVETIDEFTWLVNEGMQLFQGYLFAKPAFESFPSVFYPET